MRAPVAGLLLVAAAAFGCAQPGTPPGGEPDRAPPRVVEVVPASLDTLRNRTAPVVIRFDERISERLEGVRDWEEAVIVSPATSPHRVDAGRRRLEISLVEGWEPDRVYRVVVRPVFRDLFENRRLEPVDLVFSTGAPISEAALAGFVTDRLTGSPVADARVEAVRSGEATPHIALSDTAGFFALPFMPAGSYQVRAWVDQDRDRAVGFFEIQDSLEAELGVADTAVVELALLRPDTTPARLARAEPVDSARVRLVFDDYFAAGPVDGEARLHTVPDSALLGPAPLFHPARLDAILAAESGAEPAAEAPALPSQELILYAPDLLMPDSSYYVRVRDLTNIYGVTGGGGTAGFVMPPRPEPGDTVPADTAPGDTLPPDTVPPDTVPGARLPPDTVPGRDGRDR